MFAPKSRKFRAFRRWRRPGADHFDSDGARRRGVRAAALLRYAATKKGKSVAKLQVSARAVGRDVTGAVRGSEV